MGAAPVEALALVLMQDAQLPAQKSKAVTLQLSVSVQEELPHRECSLLQHARSHEVQPHAAHLIVAT